MKCAAPRAISPVSELTVCADKGNLAAAWLTFIICTDTRVGVLRHVQQQGQESLE